MHRRGGCSGGGGASNGQHRLTIAGQPIYLGERKPGRATCRDDVAAAVEVLVAGGGGPVLTVKAVHAAMASSGSRWSRATVAHTMSRMTRPARRPPYLQLERVAVNRYRVVRGARRG